MGTVNRAHGLRGEVVVKLVTDRVERVAVGSVLRTSRGVLRVAESRPFKDRHLVRFEGATTREDAEALAGLSLLAEPIDDPDELWVHELVGCTVRDVAGSEYGVVEAVQENPAADLLVLESGALVPVVFVTELRDGVITIDPPAGLFEL
ncbi:MAG: ribosome maturation factor RimM [Acidimicrobiia bacterium]|nr:ribosome maturation factor RimM [Acidimicrobiia bacterium]